MGETPATLFDLLDSPESGAFAFATGFAEVEEGGGHKWRWGLGPVARIEGAVVPKHGMRARIKFKLPAPASRLQLFLADKIIGDWKAGPAEEEFQFEWEIPERATAWELRFVSSAWERSSEDLRPISFLVQEFRLEPIFQLAGKICPYPFSRMEMPGSPFVPCCQSWLREEYFSLPAGDDPWNGPAALELRKSIYDGSFKFCRLDRCRTSLVDRDELKGSEEFPLSASNLASIRLEEAVMPNGPSAATLMGDPRCNLACESCRPQKITHLAPGEEKTLQEMNSWLDRYSNGLENIKMAGDGEVFFSPALQFMVRKADRFPSLKKIEILTNGILLDEKKMQELLPGSRFIQKVNVSVDAGDSETYRRVRGGDWERLLANLSWMAEERKSGRFRFFGLTFVLRAGNFLSLPGFFSMAERLGVDEVYVSRLLPWERMAIDFASEAVHLEEHPHNFQFQQMWKNIRHRHHAFAVRTNLP